MKIDVLNANTEQKILDRVNQIQENHSPQWGKMNAAEVLKHLRKGLEPPLGRLELKKPNFFFKLLLAKNIKNKITNDEVYGKNLPTAPEFLTHDKSLSFQDEKSKLMQTIQDFVKHEDEKLEAFEHPFFGKLTAHEWRKSQWKHLNHHLSQFGV